MGRLLFLVVSFGFINVVWADVFRPAYLELSELGEDRYSVLWKVPAQSDSRRLAAYVVLPDGAKQVTKPHATRVADAWIERWEVEFPGGLAGQIVRVEGQAVGVTDIMARVERLDGSSQVARLPPEKPHFLVEPPRGIGAIAWAYFAIGVEHILAGFDHLLFVLALLLIVKSSRRIVATVTAFTVAHSLTLAAATLGWVYVPGPPVEAIIALSIVFVAAEFIHSQRGKAGLTQQAPWLVAFAFGLLHGLGFAGALAEVGLPQSSLPLALLTFNIGVEAGQLMFIFLVLFVRAAARAIPASTVHYAPQAVAYVIGTIAAYWTLERVSAF